jgi:mono/diheme cytochrome c family protein
VLGATPEAAGRYLVLVGSCNDCHTDGFAESVGKQPAESEWLTGSAVGFMGPWGTSYPLNLRLYVQKLTEDERVQKAPVVVGRPPMPYPALHAMSDPDLRALYRYIRSLGPKGAEAPSPVPPGEKPKTPVFPFVPVVPGG